ncbi:Peptide transporter PTR2 [Vanrija pseudolonga]|uniref:Peptide transporter PTR2 n=1 Tax=Vanrija pseudolonga TaxID=143232 RepID=A0AAF0YDX4_9TREE|nr:Peptide transporter PTR2 [Vanrija pseudolonga]
MSKNDKLNGGGAGQVAAHGLDFEDALPPVLNNQFPHDDDPDTIPTAEELETLRKVAAPMPFIAILLCVVEFAERASYYGCSSVFFNFVNNPLPKGGNGAGAVAPLPAGKNQSAGALGWGLVASNGVTSTFSFLAYVIPILGGILADTKLGRFKAIWIGTIIGFFAHVFLVIPAIPAVIKHKEGALAAFIISMLILAFAAGFIKPSLSVLLADQNPIKRPTIKVLKSGERVIVDPAITIQRWLLWFYLCINIGGFFALATTYCSRFVGFWLAFFIPGVVYLFMPLLLLWLGPRLYKAPPKGSVVVEAFAVLKFALANGGWKSLFKKADPDAQTIWDRAKPSWVNVHEPERRHLIVWDDIFVDEIKQSIQACAVFMLIPIFNLADGGIANQKSAMSTAMILNNVPNDLLARFNPLSIIVFSPILNYGLYPFFRKIGRPIQPMTRLSIGFLLAAAGATFGAVVQDRVYKTSPCGNHASGCKLGVSAVSLWWQFPMTVLPAIGELFVNVTAYEVAYTNAPARMKGFVLAIFLFATSISSAISLALSKVIVDPHLMWPWVALAIASFLAAGVFPTYFRHLNTPPPSFSDVARQKGEDNDSDFEHPRRQASNEEKK